MIESASGIILRTPDDMAELTDREFRVGGVQHGVAVGAERPKVLNGIDHVGLADRLDWRRTATTVRGSPASRAWIVMCSAP